MEELIMESFNGAKAAYKALDDKFGTDIIILDIHEITPLADFFVIATGNNPSQIKAMADACEEEMHKIGMHISHSEGYQGAEWVLLDFGGVIVHIFHKDQRGFYSLERIWGDAKEVKL